MAVLLCYPMRLTRCKRLAEAHNEKEFIQRS
jgi:hypothetical protein